MVDPIFFYIFASLSIAMVVVLIFQTNPVGSALALVFSFFNLAALYVLLQAPFVAVLQILVYAGAVMVLFVFVIMFLNLRPEDLASDKITQKKALVIVLGIVFIGLMAYLLSHIPALPFQQLGDVFGEAKPVGRLLFTKYLIPFELISILILVALIGVFILAKKAEVRNDNN